MKKFTKAIAAFCAMAMIFGVFSATVFAEETGANEVATEAVAEAQPEEAEAADKKAAKKEAKAEEKAEKEAAKEEKQAEKEAAKEAKQSGNDAAEEGFSESAGDADVAGDEEAGGEEAGGETFGALAAGAQPESTDENDDAEPEENTDGEPESDPVPFANGVITQDDINLNGGKLPTVSGSYVLQENVNVTAGAWIETDGTAITIDLNGKTITYSAKESMYIVGRVVGTSSDGKSGNVSYINKATLTINDSGENGKITVSSSYVGGGSEDYWINNTNVGIDKSRGGCILVQNSSKLYLNGGTISGFHADDDGGAICISNGAELVMNGGTITNCSAKNGGAAISGQASSKGLIYTRSGAYYGLSIKATVTINGGTFINNTSGTRGGAIRINRCDFYLSDATITGNSVGHSGAANAVGGGAISIEKNASGQTIQISGSTKIYNNDDNEAEKANLYLVDDGIVIDASNLNSDSEIYFGAKNNTTGVAYFSGVTASTESCFNYNVEGYLPYEDNGSLKIKEFIVPKVAGYIIGIGGEILFKVYVDFGSADQADVSINYAYSYKKNGTSTAIDKDVTSFDSDANGTYFVIPVESACMTAPITITLTYEGRDTEYETTVEEVAYASAERDSSYTDIVKALLTYGGYAQVQLKINTDDLPEVAGVNFAVAPDFGLTTGTYAPSSDPDSAYAGGNVSFLSKTEVMLRFSKAALGDPSAAPEMTVTFAGGTKTIQGVSNGNYFVYTIKGYDEGGFKASQFDQSFSYTVGSVSGEYSIYTYLTVINGTGSQPMKNLAQAYYNFATKAKNMATA